MVFHKMDTEEVSDRFVVPCFVNGLEAYDGEINLGVEENMISNEYAVKLCLEHEIKRGNKIKELRLNLAVIFSRLFIRFPFDKAITDFEAGTITIYPNIDPFLEYIEEEEEKSMDDWDQLLDFNLDDIPLLGWRRTSIVYIGTSSSSGRHLTKEEAAKEALATELAKMEEVLLLQVHHDFLLWEGCNNEAKSRYNTKLANLLPRHVYSPCVINWDVLNGKGCDEEIDDMLRIKLCEAESNEEIFTFVAWIRAFNIKEPISAELWHEFYSKLMKFDEVCADDELTTRRYQFRLGGCAHNLTLLEFARRLGLYHADELEEDGFDVYFQGGLRSDDHFNSKGVLNIPGDPHNGLYKSWFYPLTPESIDARIFCMMLGLYGDTPRSYIEDGGAYNLPGYAQPQYDQYYQQYPSQPLQYPP
ncbi:hypothetical protein Tco_1090216 [Tanacetum coccineum]|uniref:Uncharacterized protein n=1 Tax=Tanacetum coccineum TaxID=301880 RepID=A0ABQ5I3J6_9ASTR